MIVSFSLELYQSVFEGFTDLLEGIVFILIKNTNIEAYKKNLLIRKFNLIRDELFEFVKNHQQLISTSAQVIKREGTEVSKLTFDSYDSAEEFLCVGKFFKFIKNSLDSIGFNKYTMSYHFHPLEIKIVPFVKEVLNIENREATVDDLKMLKDKWLVVNEKNINTKCSLADFLEKIKRRKREFNGYVVSKERINELSFILNSATEHYLTNKKCALCRKDFKFNEELCKSSFGTIYHNICLRSLWKLHNGGKICEDKNEFYFLLNIMINKKQKTPTEAEKKTLQNKMIALHIELF